MLTLVVKQKSTIIDVDHSIDRINVVRRIPQITVFDDKVFYVEPIVYRDGGLYDATGTPVDAEYYNTTLWQELWDAGSP